MQSIINNSDFTNFLQDGAVLQTELDQFKLIWGPFEYKPLDSERLLDEKTVIFKPDFWDFVTGKPHVVLSGSNEICLTRQDFIHYLRQQKTESASIIWGASQDEFFKIQFDWSFNLFNAKVLEKSVPIIFQKGQCNFGRKQLAQTLLTILEGNHYGTTYGFWEKGSGFIGQTPELLVDWKSESKSLRTMALAGTTKVEDEMSLVTDPKIKREHQIVVDDIVETLKTFGFGNIDIKPRQLLKLKHLNHLQTEISIAHVGQNDAIKVMGQLHPTAALGIYPRKDKLFRQVKDLPGQESRKNFAAPFGFIDCDRIHVVAAIRNFLFTPTDITIFSGCGITSESLLSSELDEVERKRNSVKRMMGFSL